MTELLKVVILKTRAVDCHALSRFVQNAKHNFTGLQSFDMELTGLA
jgi:hypothetical protein